MITITNKKPDRLIYVESSANSKWLNAARATATLPLLRLSKGRLYAEGDERVAKNIVWI